MTEECKTETCQCECGKIMSKFFFISGAVFLGVLLALLVASALLQPKMPCPCKKMMNGFMPGFEKQLPPFEGHRPDFKPGQFPNGQIPQGQLPQGQFPHKPHHK